MKLYIFNNNKAYYLILLVSFLLFSNCVGFDAQPYDSENLCWGSYEEVENEFGFGGTCEDSLTFARDSEGRLWHFSDACIPDGYTKVQTPSDEILTSPDC